MDDSMPSPAGLRPSLRQVMILVFWAALLSTATRAMIRWGLFSGAADSVCLIVALTVGVYPMPLLAGLLRVLDRPGWVRAWYCSACLTLANFVGGLAYCLLVPACYVLTGRRTVLFPMWPLVGLVGLACGGMQWRTSRPRACPSCGRRGVIPVARPLRPGSSRLISTGKTGWCATCGVACERETLGGGWVVAGGEPGATPEVRGGPEASKEGMR